MKKWIKIIMALFMVTMISLIPVTSSVQLEKSGILTEPDNDTITSSKTVNVFCLISNIDGGYRKVEKEMLEEEYQWIQHLATEHKDSLMTIITPSSTEAEVSVALETATPFFEAVAPLTEDTVSELQDLYLCLRERVKEPKNPPGSTGNWNGFPTPAYANLACGVYSLSRKGLGYALGTHTLLPTLGADITVIWRNSYWMGFDPFINAPVPAETMTVGLLGVTSQMFGHFGIVLGFAGLLIGVQPSGIIFPIILSLMMIGVAGAYFGLGIVPA